MSVEALIITCLIGGIAGWLAAVVMRGRGLGILGNIVVGIVGAFLASFLLPRLGIVIGGGWVGAIIHAFIGAVILLFLISLIKRA
ncbi:MAG TPA: GlsB/YeaQ/YmgE family stress response membrane protein [Tahibacter sp.]|nr:GlsB/YeaQ/YmgE family stress response membrane protein [Tahibacter sp.]